MCFFPQFITHSSQCFFPRGSFNQTYKKEYTHNTQNIRDASQRSRETAADGTTHHDGLFRLLNVPLSVAFVDVGDALETAGPLLIQLLRLLLQRVQLLRIGGDTSAPEDR